MEALEITKTEIVDTKEITRRGRYIWLAAGLTATEGREGRAGLPTLTIRKKGKVVKLYRGSSLVFANNLTEEDKKYLASLASE